VFATVSTLKRERDEGTKGVLRTQRSPVSVRRMVVGGGGVELSSIDEERSDHWALLTVDYGAEDFDQRQKKKHINLLR
jgi:hypothetical protein